ncbi:MAG: hypothetical protein HS129_00970 [Leptospiraceae bacterium]|nr:hypothetical protein [Leptospiraceae bacterium]
MKKPSNIELIQSVQYFKATGKLEPFLKIAGIWIVTYARDIFHIRDGLESEMYFLIQKKKDECIRLFRDNPLTQFPSFFNIYCKHLTLNMLRIHRKQKNQDYLALWNETIYMNSKTKKYKSKFKVHSTLENCSQFSKVVICLRFNIELDLESKIFLENTLRKNGIKINSFYNDYFQSIQKYNHQVDTMLRKLNSINRRIFDKSYTDIEELKLRKKQIINFLEKPACYITFKELGELFKIPTHRVVMIYNETIKRIQRKFCERKVA